MNTINTLLHNVGPEAASSWVNPSETCVKDTSKAAMNSLEKMGPLMKGAIKTKPIITESIINWKYGYVFITTTDGTNDIFVSSNTYIGGLPEFEKLNKGDEVTFNVKNSPKGPEAVNVSVVK